MRCELRLSDLRDLSSAVSRVRRLLDLDADPEAVRRADPALAPMVEAAPGIRVPGAVDGEELLLRTMIGHQISVATARTTTAQLAEALGERLKEPDEDLTTIFPTAAKIAENSVVLRGPQRRIEAIRAVAEKLAAKEIEVHIGRDPDELREELLALPGVGPWTADYVLMRLLGVPDVLLSGDLALRKGAEALGVDDLGERAQAWRPWRSYAGMYLWRKATEKGTA